MDHADGPELRRDAPPGLFLDRAGRWFHDGQRVRHRRLEELLHRSIVRAADGSLQVTTGRDVLPFFAEGAPFTVRAFDTSAGAAAMLLSDGTAEAVAAQTFLIDACGAIHCAVRGGTFWALLSRSATQVLAAHVNASGRGFHGPFAGAVLQEAPAAPWAEAP